MGAEEWSLKSSVWASAEKLPASLTEYLFFIIIYGIGCYRRFSVLKLLEYVTS